MKVETLQIGVGSIIYSNTNALNTLNDMEQLRSIALELFNSLTDNEKKAYPYNRETLEKILSINITPLSKYSIIHDNLYREFACNTIFNTKDYLIDKLKDIQDVMNGISDAARKKYDFNKICNTVAVESNEIYGIICKLEKLTENGCIISNVIKAFMDAFLLLYQYIHLSTHIHTCDDDDPGVRFKEFIAKLREYILKLIDNTTIEIIIEK